MESIDKFIQDSSISHDRKKLPEHEAIRLLWIKVILRAAYDWVLYRDSKNNIYKKIANDAYRWLFEPAAEKTLIRFNENILIVDSSGFNSLEKLCDVLDIDIDTVRSFAGNLTRNEIKKLEFLDRSKKNIKTEIAKGEIGGELPGELCGEL